MSFGEIHFYCLLFSESGNNSTHVYGLLLSEEVTSLLRGLFPLELWCYRGSRESRTNSIALVLFWIVFIFIFLE